MKLGPRQKKWVRDITKYEQAHGTLCDGKGFCCLGVYAHTQVKEPWNKNWEYMVQDFVQGSYLANRDWIALGLNSRFGGFSKPLYFKGKTHIRKYKSLAELNDSRQITPEEMAVFIQKNARCIFTEPK